MFRHFSSSTPGRSGGFLHVEPFSIKLVFGSVIAACASLLALYFPPLQSSANRAAGIGVGRIIAAAVSCCRNLR